jgi:hypothetical protein
MHHLRKGGLHKALGISLTEKIPQDKKEAAAKSSNKHIAAMGQLALNFEKMKH